VESGHEVRLYTIDEMSSLATETIALRAGGLWAVGIFIIAAVSAYTARPDREGPVSVWVVIPIMLGKIGMFLGPTGVALIVGRAVGQLGENARMAAAAAVLMVGVWVSLVLVQIVQNVAYRLIGAPVQPIRFWNGSKPKRRRRLRKA
jgi:hypothetical protein